jgi:hypothetical protein
MISKYHFKLWNYMKRGQILTVFLKIRRSTGKNEKNFGFYDVSRAKYLFGNNQVG